MIYGYSDSRHGNRKVATNRRHKSHDCRPVTCLYFVEPAEKQAEARPDRCGVLLVCRKDTMKGLCCLEYSISNIR